LEVCTGRFGAGRVRRTKHERPRKACGLIRLMCRRRSGGSAAAEGKKLNGLLLGRVRKWGFCIVLESDLMGWRVGGSSTFLPSEATGNERSFEKERQRTPRQREWTAKHPLSSRGRDVAGEWDQFPRISIEQHRGGCFLPTLKTP